MSPDRGETHHAPVRSPPALPVEVQRIVGPNKRICPWRPTPVRVPSRETSASLEAIGSLFGHGCPSEQLPSISLAAMPERRSRGPSAHHTGPSPSQTWVGVQSNDCPAGTVATWSAKTNDARFIATAIPPDYSSASRHGTDRRITADCRSAVCGCRPWATETAKPSPCTNSNLNDALRARLNLRKSPKISALETNDD